MSLLINPYQFTTAASSWTLINVSVGTGTTLNLPAGYVAGDLAFYVKVSPSVPGTITSLPWLEGSVGDTGIQITTGRRTMTASDVATPNQSGWTNTGPWICSVYRGPTLFSAKHSIAVATADPSPGTLLGFTKNASSKVVLCMAAYLDSPGTITTPGTFTKQYEDSSSILFDVNPSTTYVDGTNVDIAYTSGARIGAALWELT